MCSVYTVSACICFLIEVLFQVLSEFGNTFSNIRFEIIVFCDTSRPMTSNDASFHVPMVVFFCFADVISPVNKNGKQRQDEICIAHTVLGVKVYLFLLLCTDGGWSTSTTSWMAPERPAKTSVTPPTGGGSSVCWDLSWEAGTSWFKSRCCQNLESVVLVREGVRALLSYRWARCQIHKFSYSVQRWSGNSSRGGPALTPCVPKGRKWLRRWDETLTITFKSCSEYFTLGIWSSFLAFYWSWIRYSGRISHPSSLLK